jgi:hypothetical protein
MKEALIDHQMAFPSHCQATEVAKPGERAFDFPPSFVAAQWAFLLRPGLFTVAPVRTDHLNAFVFQASSHKRPRKGSLS